jgi:hypothetical protein
VENDKPEDGPAYFERLVINQMKNATDDLFCRSKSSTLLAIKYGSTNAEMSYWEMAHHHPPLKLACYDRRMLKQSHIIYTPIASRLPLHPDMMQTSRYDMGLVLNHRPVITIYTIDRFHELIQFLLPRPISCFWMPLPMNMLTITMTEER